MEDMVLTNDHGAFRFGDRVLVNRDAENLEPVIGVLCGVRYEPVTIRGLLEAGIQANVRVDNGAVLGFHAKTLRCYP